MESTLTYEAIRDVAMTGEPASARKRAAALASAWRPAQKVRQAEPGLPGGVLNLVAAFKGVAQEIAGISGRYDAANWAVNAASDRWETQDDDPGPIIVDPGREADDASPVAQTLARFQRIVTQVCLGGVVAAVPANVIAGSDPPGGPAWFRHGRPLPYAGHHRTSEQSPDALIAVEQVRGPVLLIAAGADQVWPSAAMARALSARLHRHGDPHGHTLLDYPRAGHALGYLIPRLPPGLLPPGLADQPADQAARVSAWSRTIEFLRHLPQPW